MRFFLAVLAVMLVAGCSKKSAVDAGVAQAALTRHSTDLRTIVLTVMPDFRGLEIRRSVAKLTRQYAPGTLTQENVDATLKRNGFVRNDAGLPARDAMTMAREGDSAVVTLELNPETVLSVITAPASMGTQQLAVWFPDGAFVREDFEFALEYRSRPTRAAWLCWQLVNFSLRSRWEAGSFTEGFTPEGAGDGGEGELPSKFQVSLTNAREGEKLDINRDEGNVTLLYRMTTASP